MDPFPGHRAGGLDGIRGPSGSCQILQWSTKYFILTRLVTRVEPTLMPTGAGLTALTIIQFTLNPLEVTALGQGGQASQLHGQHFWK